MNFRGKKLFEKSFFPLTSIFENFNNIKFQDFY